MEIEYVVVSSNDNRMYLDFWNIVKDSWIKIGIKPILVLIGDKDKITDNGDYIIHELKQVENIDTGFQSQIARMYISRFYKDSVLITSDIDMIPLNKNYFNDVGIGVEDDNIIILSSDAYKTVRYPICYNVAKGQIFCDIIDCDVDFSEYCKKLLSYDWGWDTDEMFFGMKLQSYNNEKVIKKKRGWINGMALKRIDRNNWIYDVEKLKSGYYIDSHSLRPFSKYKNEIEKIIKYL